MEAVPIFSRRILHIDMDAFFASVEQVLNPDLRGKPLIIGGEKTDLRGVVSTASYEARVFGVHSAMPLSEAIRRCPHGIFMRGNFAHYREASSKVRRILETVSPVVQMASIDEAFVDVTGSQRLFGGDDAIAAHLKDRIREETELPCTIAITPNKLVSKIASDEAKPDGYLRLADEDVEGFMQALPLRKIPGIGPRTRETLERLRIFTAGELAGQPPARLLRVFGPAAHGLQQRARGISTAPVAPYSPPKSISRETTFEQDLRDWERIERVLLYLAERAAHALREQELECRRVSLKVRYADFDTPSFATTLDDPTALDHEIGAALRSLMPKAQARRAPVRLIGVTLANLRPNQHQLALFGREGAEKWGRVLESIDGIRGKHGFNAIRSAKTMALGRTVELATPSLSR